MTNDDKIAWMRDKGVLQAQWTPDGSLVMAVLGPERLPHNSDDRPLNASEEDYEDLLCASS